MNRADGTVIVRKVVLVVSVSLIAQIGASYASGQDAPKANADPRIATALQQVSAQRIQANINRLVSFGTRLTLSAQDPGAIASGHGIGAAREWIKEEFEQYSKECGGCLEVKTDSFTEGPVDRIPKPTEIANEIGVLKGSDPAQAKR